jgi:hypothetical protein
MEEATKLAMVEAELVEIYLRGGCLRRQSVGRLKADGAQKYKKGSEVRLVANSPAELERMRGLLKAADFKSGHSYSKGNRFVQPIYGEEQVLRFCGLLEGVTGVGKRRVKQVRRSVSRKNARTLRGNERSKGDDDRMEASTYRLLGLRLVERLH